MTETGDQDVHRLQERINELLKTAERKLPESLTIWTVYDHPLDYPDYFVVRPSTVSADGTQLGGVILCNDLEEARAYLAPLGLMRIDRHPTDEPQIVETWL